MSGPMSIKTGMEMRAALHRLVDAWESLPGGSNRSALQVQAWLIETMKPAIDNARRKLGREIPK